MKSHSFRRVIIITWLTIIFLVTFVSCEFYSSVHKLEKLVDHEKFLLEKMEKFITLNENKLDYLKKKFLLFEMNREDSTAAEQPEEYYRNPINAYFLIKRLSSDWEKMRNFMDYEIGANALKNIDKVKDNYTPTGDDDYEGAIGGILRLQNVYRLKAKDMARGVLGGVKYNVSELLARDCFDFGKVALKTNNSLAAHAWLSEALDRSETYKKSSLIDAESLQALDVEILMLLAEVKFKLGDFKGAEGISNELKHVLPNDTKILELSRNVTQQQFVLQSKDIKEEHDPIPLLGSKIDDTLSYHLTCSGHVTPLPSDERDLRCGYLTETHPFLLLAPIKVEELYLDPLLVLYHDVIYDSEIEKLIELASNKMTRATVLNSNVSVVSEARTSQFVFFSKKIDRVFQKIDERVADMTGLNMEAAEHHQLANYGIGGHYSQHFDYFSEERDKDGDRIATVLFYLSEVEQGGGTAFPLLRSLVKPKKGAAVFWYNLHTSGDGDIRSLHGACPVLVGSKWVLNRWIRERGQEFVRPCNLVSDTLQKLMF